jgi:centrosomal protein CEP120
VRVSDQYVPIKDGQGSTKGLLRCIVYLQDVGEVKGGPSPTKVNVPPPTSSSENRNPNDGEY